MSKIGIVVKFEIVRQLKKPSFWVSLLLLPLLIFGIIGLSVINSSSTSSTLEIGSDLDNKNIGITNDSDLFPTLTNDFKNYLAEQSSDGSSTKVSNIANKTEGINQTISGELDLYYYIPSNFAESKNIEIYNKQNKNLFSDYGAPLSRFLAERSIKKLDLEDQIAVTKQIQYNTITLNSKGESENILGKAIVPLCVLAIFYILICVFGNRLSTALAEEKENRISEMLLTTIDPKSFVLGKIISLIALGFIQIFVFIIPIISTLIIFRDNAMVAPIISAITIEPWSFISNIILLIVSYFLFTGGCTFISSLTPTARDASNYMAVIILGTILPLFFLNNFLAETANSIVYLLTYFPLSAPFALMLRNAFGSLPTFELILGIIELAAFSAIFLALTVKSFQKNAINFSVVKPNFKIKTSWKR